MGEVAKTYEKWERIGEPFKENNKYYINVINPKTNELKKVRWYGEIFSLCDYKKLFGFDKGYITIFKGVDEKDQEYFKFVNTRYATFFGWYLVSTEELTEPLPEHIIPVKLAWEEISENDVMLPQDEIKKISKKKGAKV